ncbi:hypothetical protein DL96DRAFT_1689672 [Flagelloscypha sp. PMI_526]|nr:hypothetical protein DL96DRAFT_1689672 [Flagelloscypha sp. PMI_526]
MDEPALNIESSFTMIDLNTTLLSFWLEQKYRKSYDLKMGSLSWLALSEEMYDIAARTAAGGNDTCQGKSAIQGEAGLFAKEGILGVSKIQVIGDLEKGALENFSLEDEQVASTRPDSGSQPNVHPLRIAHDHRFLFHCPDILHMRGQTSVIRIRALELRGPHLVVDASSMEKEKAQERRKGEKRKHEEEREAQNVSRTCVLWVTL